MSQVELLDLAAKDTSVFILAAGRGERMRPLTDSTPKPLLQVGPYSLLEHHLLRLQQLGFQHIVINIDHLGEQIIDQIGDGSRFKLDIQYSDERSSGALETAGGIQKALPLISSDYFIALNADIWTDFNFHQLLNCRAQSATLVLVANPQHNINGDFKLQTDSRYALAKRKTNINENTNENYTFSGIGLYHKTLFKDLTPGKSKLAPLLFQATDNNQVDGLLHSGQWNDIGTPERLKELNENLASTDQA